MRLSFDFWRREGFPTGCPDDLMINYGVGLSLDESVILAPRSTIELKRASSLIEAWRLARVSRWNHLREYSGDLPSPYVLLIDKCLDDALVDQGDICAETFSRMLDTALAENPGCNIVFLVDPKLTAKANSGHFDPSLPRTNPRVFLRLEDTHPVRLLEEAQAVYTVASMIGFEALIWGKPVRTFGMPFYAGWGLTQDDLPAPKRRQPVQLENLVHAALIDYPRYIDPETGKRCGPERVIEWIKLQRHMRERFAPHLLAYAITQKKHPIVREFFQGSTIEFVEAGKQVPRGRDCIVWGRKPLPPSMSSSQRVIRIEDGFMRSVGLGAEFVRPLSWVMDGRGIYYDATQPSDLEHLLMTKVFDDALLQRARDLRQRIVESGLTKYNVGAEQWQRPASAGRVILVPGQVESDASIEFGAPEGVCNVRRNMELLRAVRQDNPDAHIVYKPHPDVLAGLRKEGVGEDMAKQWCDEQVFDISMSVMLAHVDEVHVMTSLTGFEALLRCKKVVCYGQPFYSGWGLTHDKVPIARRTRRLSIDELVAGVLILYPTYVSRKTHRFTTPEQALNELVEWREGGGEKMSLWRFLYRLYLRLFRY